ncbi:alpha/beta-type small acid-soluble spore protein [Clostridium sp. MB40-C1]|uniref:alpha/beta-type small acid-soluble spore protein n=1 Tax=Clostridium sp. MB40-C1 TaxID=3070996 RepID=UPI0027E01AC1|nr:alpha/beta-type small acid-soluble spore protein [Clostridium sp. MB40-C1]WMJ82158.1 alpha/beta-type small acid-soluble spore protein [Clostridium sp. MB40-C1]
MTNNNNNTGRNRTLIPEARQGLNRFKAEVASELGMANYEEMDKGNLPSRQNGYVGGTMVKKMVESYEQGLK